MEVSRMRIRLFVPAVALVAAAAIVSVVSPLAPRADAAAETWTVDPVHSFLLFRTDHMGVGACYGRFDTFSGTVSYDAQNPAGSSVSIEAKTDSVDTGSGDRDKHLRSPDFFDAAQFPTLSFKSTSVKGGAGGLDVTGDLTMHGVSKPVTVHLTVRGPADPFKKGPRIGFEGTFDLNRVDWGVGKAQGDTTVKVTVAIEATKP
jgi:polyisoprenoid-binding protein YceI